jgi:hypothetical protein
MSLDSPSRRPVAIDRASSTAMVSRTSWGEELMEFREGLVANETQYFADRFDPALERRVSTPTRRCRNRRAGTLSQRTVGGAS